MNQKVKALCLLLALFVFMSCSALADDPVYVAKFGSNSYENLNAAIAAANTSADGGIVTLLKNITLDQNLTINKNIVIDGKNQYTISRKNTYTGTLFTISSGAKLTFRGVTLDGANNYSFDRVSYDSYVAQNSNIFNESSGSFVTSQSGAPVGTTYAIQNNGELDLIDSTIQNFYGNNNSSVINSGYKAVTRFTSLYAKHVAMEGSGALIRVNGEASKLYIEKGTLIEDIYGEGNGGAMQAYAPNTTNVIRSEVIMNGGTIVDCKTVGGNASLIMLRNADMTINDGTITDCSSARGTSNNRGGVIYLNYNASFVMNGGKIINNSSIVRAAVDVRDETNKVELLGGSISENTNNPTTVGTEGYCGLGEDTTIGENMVIDNGVRLLGGKIDNNGYIGGSLVVDVGTTDTLTLGGSGTVKGDIHVFSNANLKITDGTYLGNFLPENGAKISISGGIFANDVSQYLAPGFALWKNDDGTYRVITQEEYDERMAKLAAKAVPYLPQTGDNSALILWAALLSMSVAAFALRRKARA